MSHLTPPHACLAGTFYGYIIHITVVLVKKKRPRAKLPVAKVKNICYNANINLSFSEEDAMILVLSSDEDICLRWRRLLFSWGIASSSSSYRYAINTAQDHTLDAVLLPDPYDVQKPPRFCYSWHPRHPQVPVVVITQPLREPSRDMLEADIRMQGDMAPTKLMEKLLFALSAYHQRDIADRIKGPARDHLLMREPTWGGVSLHLTPTERTIFRYLLCIHPHCATAKELLRNCIKPGTAPTVCNIPSHIYRINLKAGQTLGHHIVGIRSTVGYQLLLDLT
jgi:DNA-binding response OmpR family regulator